MSAQNSTREINMHVLFKLNFAKYLYIYGKYDIRLLLHTSLLMNVFEIVVELSNNE